MHGGMTPAVKLAHAWVELFEIPVTNPTKKKDFMAKHAAIDKKYRKLPEDQQGEFTRAIHIAVKRRLK